MREGWNVLLNINDDSFRVVLDGCDKADALARAETLLVKGEEKVYLVRASSVVVVDQSDMTSSLAKGIL